MKRTATAGWWGIAGAVFLLAVFLALWLRPSLTTDGVAEGAGEVARDVASSTDSVALPEQVVGEGRTVKPSDSTHPTGRSVLIKDGATLLPIAGATVALESIPTGTTVEPPKPRSVSTTSVEGRVVVQLEPTKAELLWVRAKGYFPKTFTWVEWTDHCASFASDPVVVSLPPKGTLIVRVEDDRSQPIERAYVRVLRWNEQRQLPDWNPQGWPVFEVPGFYTFTREPTDEKIAAGTDANGELVVPGMPCGVPLYANVSGRAAEVSGVVTIPVESQHRTARITLTSTASGELSGRVLWRNGEPAPGQKVVFTPAPEFVDYRITNERGEYEARGATPGVFAIQCQSPGANAITVSVHPGKNQVPDILIDELLTVTGRIVSASGLGSQPTGPGLALNNANIHLVAWSGREPVAQVTPASDGAFKLALPRGDYLVEVQRRGRQGPLAVLAVSSPAAGLEIPIDDGLGSFHFRLSNPALSSVATLVFERIGEGPDDPVRRAIGTSTGLTRRSLARDENGVFTYSHLPKGKYDLLVDGADAGSAWVREFEVFAGADVDLGALECGFGEIHGSLVPVGFGTGDDTTRAFEVDQNGDTIKRWPDVAAVSPTGVTFSSTPNPKGEFSFPKVSAGPWLLYLHEHGSDAQGSFAVDVRPGKVVRRDIPLNASLAKLEGVVRVDGTPVAGCRLNIGPTDKRRDVPSLGWKLGVTTDAAGHYEFADVIPGVHLVTAVITAPNRYALLQESKQVRLTDESTVRLEFDFPRADVEVVFMKDGEVHSDVETVMITSLSDAGTRTINVSLAGHSRLPLFAEAQLVMWSRLSFSKRDPRGGKSEHYHCALIPASRAASESPLKIQAASGAVEIELPAGIAVPRLCIEAMGNTRVGYGLSYPELWREAVSPTRVRFVSVPDGAQLRLYSTSSIGAESERSFAFSGMGVFSFSWQ